MSANFMSKIWGGEMQTNTNRKYIKTDISIHRGGKTKKSVRMQRAMGLFIIALCVFLLLSLKGEDGTGAVLLLFFGLYMTFTKKKLLKS